MIRSRRHTIRALLAAAVVGGVALALELTLFTAAMALQTENSSSALAYLSAAPMVAVVTIPAFFVGALLVAAPVWAIIEGTTVRSALAAILIGALLATTTGVLILFGLGVIWWQSLAGAAAALGPPGALAGWVLHRVAYGRAP